MKPKRHSTVFYALRDACLGLAIYSGIVLLALEDRAQAGTALPAFSAHGSWLSDGSLLTLFVLGLLFATLTAFITSVWRHFGRTFVLNRVSLDQAQVWSVSRGRSYRRTSQRRKNSG